MVADRIARGAAAMGQSLPAGAAGQLAALLTELQRWNRRINLTAIRDINEIMLLTQPGHLQKISNRVLGAEERDETRARMLRTKLKNVRLRE